MAWLHDSVDYIWNPFLFDQILLQIAVYIHRENLLPSPVVNEWNLLLIERWSADHTSYTFALEKYQ